MYIKSLFFKVFLLGLIHNTYQSLINDIFGIKSCPSPKLFTKLQVQPFIGKWYNHIALPSIFEKGKCGSTSYYYDAKNTTLYNQDKEKRGDKWVTAPVTTVTNERPGSLTLHMFFISAYLNILDTDYTSYAIVYSCRDLYITEPLRMAWILTRNATIADEVKVSLYKKAETLFKTADINISDLKPVVQDCPDN